MVDFDTNRKRVFDFLLGLVINSNLSLKLHRFGDTTAYRLKIANLYLPHPHSTPLLEVTPFEFGVNVIYPETRIMGLPYDEEIVIVCQTMWTQSTSVTDGRTDR